MPERLKDYHRRVVEALTADRLGPDGVEDYAAILRHMSDRLMPIDGQFGGRCLVLALDLESLALSMTVAEDSRRRVAEGAV